MGAILAFLGTAVARIFADKVLAWIAIKAILVFLFITVVPLLLNNFLYDIIEIMMNFAGAQAGSASSFSGSMSFSGFSGWLISTFRIPEMLSILVSAYCLRLALSMIPFVRLVG
jgi:hypothetical protein